MVKGIAKVRHKDEPQIEIFEKGMPMVTSILRSPKLRAFLYLVGTPLGGFLGGFLGGILVSVNGWYGGLGGATGGAIAGFRNYQKDKKRQESNLENVPKIF